MFPKPKPHLKPNTYAYNSEPMVKPTGFREYDARWLFGSEINLMGVEALGLGLGTLIHRARRAPRYRHRPRFPLLFGVDQDGVGQRPRSPPAARSTTSGLRVTPMAYFAQFALDVPCVAMVTASHNDNGWTGVKMGANRAAHLRPRRDDAAQGDRARRPLQRKDGGAYAFVENFPTRYIADLTKRPKLSGT